MTKPYRILNGNCLDQLKTLEDNSVDSVVTDPPYGLSAQPDMMNVLETWMRGEEYRQGKGFMGKEWDSFVPGPAIWKEVYRVLKPGGHILAFSGTRTYDLTVLAIRLAGFEIRDMISWVYGSGMPKSHNIGKAIDKAAGVERAVIGKRNVDTNWRGKFEPDHELYKGKGEFNGSRPDGHIPPNYHRVVSITAPATPEAAQWEGWGTALKPSVEPVVLARKPLEGTVAENVLRHGTGGLNIDGCRVPVSESDDIHAKNPHTQGGFGHGNAQVYGDKGSGTPIYNPTQGRWPANLIHDGSDEVLELFPHTKSIASKERHEEYEGEGHTTFLRGYSDASNQRDDEGSAARFFYCAKTTKRDRDEGLDAFDAKPSYMVENGSKTAGSQNGIRYERTTTNRNTHVTVKPTSLMSYLCKLITPPNGVVLDPFMGSGSTGKGAVLEGFQFIGMDMEPEYCEIAEARIEFALRSLEKPAPVKKTKTVKRGGEDTPQEDVPSLFDL